MNTKPPHKIKKACIELMQCFTDPPASGQRHSYFYSAKYNIGCMPVSFKAVKYLVYHKGTRRAIGFYVDLFAFMAGLSSTMTRWRLPQKGYIILPIEKCLLVHNLNNNTLVKVLEENPTIEKRITRVVYEDAEKNKILLKPQRCGKLIKSSHFYYEAAFFSNDAPIKNDEWPAPFYRHIFPGLMNYYREAGIKKIPAGEFLAAYRERFRKEGYEEELAKIFEILQSLSRYSACQTYYSAYTHGDLHRWNVLRNSSGIKLIDWDYCTRRNVFFDLFVMERFNPDPAFWENLFDPEKYELSSTGRACLKLVSLLPLRAGQERSLLIAFHMVAAFGEAVHIEKLKREDQRFHTLYNAILSLSVPV